MTAKRILILIGAHLSTAPRPQKEARALAEAGFDVTVAGNWFDPLLVERDLLLLKDAPYRFIPMTDFRPTSRRGRFENLLVQTRTRVARMLFAKWKKCTPDLLGFRPQRGLRLALRTRPDLTIVHSEGGLWIAEQLLSRGRKVSVDFEDWFSRDLPESARAGRPVAELNRLEGVVARRAAFSFATSNAMAREIAAAFNAPLPRVVYNVFPDTPLDEMIKDRPDAKIPSLHWYSQTIGPGRGLERLFEALQHVTVPVEVHLRGALPSHYREWLERERAKAPHIPVHTHDTVSNDELPSRIAEHDIGLALETAAITNRDLTICNKVFQYLQGGLAILATDTSGQREVLARRPDIGGIVPDGDAAALASAIDHLAGHRERLKNAKKASRDAFVDDFCWENQKGVVVDAVRTALAPEGTPAHTASTDAALMAGRG